MSSLNSIKNAEQKFNTLLAQISNTENVLQYYDNMTYNIRFYMISNEAELYLGRLIEKGILKKYVIPDDEKIIIAETGKSSKINIDSLTLKTIHANTCNSHSATTYSLEMNIKELNGCQLINQITAVSKLLGYEGYIYQPFHIDIWFSGYDNETHKPIRIIPEIGILTYTVILSEVKTNIDLGGTTYNFICSNAGIISASKEILAIGDKGVYKDLNGLSLETFANKLEANLNKTFFEQHPEYQKYYSDGKYIHIRLIDSKDNNVPTDWKQLYCSETLKNTTLLEDIFTDSEDSIIDSGFKPNKTSSLMTIFQEYCLNSNNLRDYIARPITKTKPIKNSDGLELNELYVDVIFSSSRYLKNFEERFTDLSKKSPQEIREFNYTNAYFHLMDIIRDGLLRKKYQWLFNGSDTSILEINSSVDKLWYANIPLYDIQENVLNGTSLFYKYLNTDLENKSLNLIMSKDQLLNEIKAEINRTNTVVNGVKNMSADKHLYLEDIYYCMSNNIKKEYLNNRIITERTKSYSSAQPDSAATTKSPSIIAKTGYQNIFGTNLVELQFKILGDPYWIQLCSDECIYNQKVSTVGNLQYFIFKMNTCADQKLDGTYDLENVVDFCNIYQIIESTSLFEGGKFIQNIKASIAPEFLTLGRLEI